MGAPHTALERGDMRSGVGETKARLPMLNGVADDIEACFVVFNLLFRYVFIVVLVLFWDVLIV